MVVSIFCDLETRNQMKNYRRNKKKKGNERLGRRKYFIYGMIDHKLIDQTIIEIKLLRVHKLIRVFQIFYRALKFSYCIDDVG